MISTPKTSFYLFAFLFVWACTENPFSNKNISGGKRQISGSISLKDGASPEGVVVWLQDYNIMTTSNENGEFQIFLPPSISDGTSSGIIEFDTLYFFLANYFIEQTPVLIAGGEFMYSREAINDKGKLTHPILLQRSMQITTEVTPLSIPKNYTGVIEVIVKLKADKDCSPVLNPKIEEKDKYSRIDNLGAVLVKNIDTDDILIVRSNPNANGNEILDVCNEPVRRRLRFKLSEVALSPGNNEIIPYLLMNLEGVPEGLLQHFVFQIEELSADYLKIPMRREGGRFTVTQ